MFRLAQLFLRSLLAGSALSLLFFASGASAQTAAAPAAGARTPTETVREFYRALREKRFREAFAMSIYKPAIDGLSQQEFEDLRPDFEKMAAAIPESFEISGEQISGESASVFMKVPNAEENAQPDPVPLMRLNGVWIVGDPSNAEKVRKAGGRFFLETRIETHQDEAKTMLQRINMAQIVYSAQHQGQFADLPALVTAGLVPKDIEATDSTGYRFHVTLAKDARSYAAGAEPAVYGHTGRLSFYLDPSGMKSGDTGGRPLSVPAGPKER